MDVHRDFLIACIAAVSYTHLDVYKRQGLNRTGAHKFYHALGFEEVKGFKKYL